LVVSCFERWERVVEEEDGKRWWKASQLFKSTLGTIDPSFETRG
jgi:hypothetical protein